MSQNPYESPEHESTNAASIGDSTAAEPAKMPVFAHVLCGWPLLLVAIGGAIGGGLGGLAYALNVGIYKSTLPLPVKAVLIVVTGSAAIVMWFAIGLAIHFGGGH